ncbi:MAG: FHA domain-containing protein [Deltaproteobacteria bacterium]|nr:FHA domain-containing protein [Deltaproteobacteria bacterium]
MLVEYRAPGDPGRVYSLRGGRNRLGRDDDRDVVLDDERVSGEHGIITITEDRARYLDSSSNGSMVDGQPVIGDVAELRSGSVLSLGGTSLVFLLVPVACLPGGA